MERLECRACGDMGYVVRPVGDPELGYDDFPCPLCWHPASAKEMMRQEPCDTRKAGW